jgi:putative Ca2+/H+ antiporter (TMEM165/GDT1 family)
MAAKKRSTKASRKSKPRQVTNKRWLIFSAAAGSLFNMTVTAVTSGSVLLCFFAAKRFL